jgi:aminoglycoside phosphotransferase (APT) family kinase protein
MDERPWLSEQAVSLALAQNLIENQFPFLAPVNIQHVGEGWDNTVFEVNQTWLFRFPRRELALELLANEWKILALLEPEFSLEIPVPQFKGIPSSHFKWPFAGYNLLQGQTACRAQLSEVKKRALALPLARFLKKLHSFPLTAAKALGLPPDTRGKVNLKTLVPQIHAQLIQAQKQGLIENIAPWLQFLDDLPTEIATQRPQCLVHGDLYIRHLIVNASGQLTGVIDWGDIHLGDPACDLSIVYSILPQAAHAEFWQVYGSVSLETKKLAKMRALFHCLALLIYSTDIEDPDLLREAQMGLQNCAISKNYD